jgi:hypothetical protein
MIKRLLALSFALIVFDGIGVESKATPPWQKLVPFKRIDADPNKSYALADTNGPWMILATVFRGDQADRQAQQLAYELRKKFKLEAYTHAHVFDHTKFGRAFGFNPDGSPTVSWQPRNDAVKEVAVLVGNFSSIDDDRATDTLKKVKTIDPQALKTKPDSSSQVFAGLRQAMNAKKKKGPMGNAFVVTNPLLPPEYFNSAGVDKLVLEMNKEVPHSLLDCPGKYSVKVATFTGTALIDQRKIREAAYAKKMNHTLEEAAENAHILTEALRKQGYEAYEFHEREQSIVTVGSYDLLSVPGPGGQAIPNPQIQQLIQTFGVTVGSTPGNPVMEVPRAEMERRRKMFGSNWNLLDLKPVVIEAPKRAVGSAYLR